MGTKNTRNETSINKIQCRLCLARPEKVIEIFSEPAKKMELRIKLSTFCHLDITDDDEAPKAICLECLNEVDRFSDFYKRVQDNQKLLAFSCKTMVSDEVEPLAQEFPDEVEEQMKLLMGENEEEEFLEEQLSDFQSYCEDDAGGSSRSSQLEEPALSENGDTDELYTILEIVPSEDPIEADDADNKKVIEDLWSNQNEKLSSTDSAIQLQDEATKETTVRKQRISRQRIVLDKPIRDFFGLKCNKCNSNFLTYASMKRHMAQTHSEQCYFICCNRKIFRRDALMKHINFHLDPKRFTCQICNQICKSQLTLKVHLKQHIPKEERPFSCETCGMRFVVVSQLKSHLNSHLRPDERKFVCEECGKAFAFKFVLEKHKQHMHIRQRNYMCEICARSFIDKVNLTAHKRTHDNTLPRLECTKCNALLKTKKTLQIHMRSHDPSTFICTICKRTFPTKNALVNHIQYCHSDKKYSCTICGRDFKKALNLKEHMATHTGEILYSCEYCHKTFNAKANRYAHVKKAHRTEWEAKQKLKWRQDEK